MNNFRKMSFDTAKRIVVKIGSGVLTESYGLNVNVIRSISRQISGLIKEGREVILVSSGAMASGIRKIGLDMRPDEIPLRQAVAAVGQAGLIQEYETGFVQYGIKVAQILLTSDDLSNRQRYLNARNTLNALLNWNVVPIINENDTVAVEEIQFGDNDNLAAMITLQMDADILINLTDINGLYDKDPRSNSDARLIETIETINQDINKLASEIPGALGTGGMLSKVKAAGKVTSAGIPMVIARGDEDEVLIKLFAGEKMGTFFIPKEKKLPSRKCWIALTLKSEGVVIIDDGAVDAIVERGKSLLPIGIVDVEGNFKEGASIKFLDKNGEELGSGLVNYSAVDIRKIMGLKTKQISDTLGDKPYDEVVHRDNMVITVDGTCTI
ncbi:MAG: glutamate 5-kinase [Desulfobacterales bacterium]|jgi:glutamate 5-kinase|nr:glutamate 5-kinase [Desulfobacteraceae bacterium]MBT7084610.1 glutamate 5-kinase [Desulfobacterales bacterium]MBT7696300.1 glutamate 5-kinase [Desulfobacterales bacterium]